MLSLTSISTVILLLSTASASDDALSDSMDPLSWSGLVTPIFENEGEWNCSCAYIGHKYVITSGVCVQGYTKFRIKLGPYYAHYYESSTTVLEFKYDRFIATNTSSKYDSFDNRLTIITLDQNPTLNYPDHIQRANLPLEPNLFQLNDATAANNTALDIVWARNKDGNLVQQCLKLAVLTFTDCLTIRPEVNIHEELCAAGEKVDGKYRKLCPSIGFGPILVTGLNTLLGIGIDTCVDDKPQTFIRINGYWKWINDIRMNYRT